VLNVLNDGLTSNIAVNEKTANDALIKIKTEQCRLLHDYGQSHSISNYWVI